MNQEKTKAIEAKRLPEEGGHQEHQEKVE